MDDSSTLAGFTRAPDWALWLGQFGQGLIFAGLGLFIVATLAMLLMPNKPRLSKLGTYSFALGVTTILGALLCLTVLFLKDQFQFEYVASHSWHDLPARYKIAAVWSGQQGSFLLWTSTSAIFGLLAVRSTGIYRRWFVVVYSLFLASLCGILSYETPFGILKNMVAFGNVYVPPNGLGLVPSLQNYWVIVHPPTIFTGFGSLTVPFAFAVSAMLTKDLTSWVPAVRPWVLVSLSVLGLGVIMGGLWAYETQGWGGFWAWDPVENVSFVPWLFIAALLHGIIVQTTRNRWHNTNLWLAALPFLLFVYGTFLTRSGFLDKFSIHSFAEMNRSALWILLGVLGAAWVTFVGVWATKGRALARAADVPAKQEGFNREISYQYGTIFLTGLGLAIAIGMSLPVVLGALGRNAKVVDEPLYHQVVFWFFAPIMALMAAAPFLAWRRMSAAEFWKRFAYVLGIAFWIIGGMFLFNRANNPLSGANARLDFPFGLSAPRIPWVMFLFYLTSVAIVGNLWRLGEMFRRSKTGVGGFIAHMGVATVLAGLVLSRGLEQKEQVLVMDGTPAQGLGYTISYAGMTSNPETDRDNKVEFIVDKAQANGQNSTFTARPGYFLTTGEDGSPTPFTWPHIQRGPTNDLYLSLQAPVFSLWDQPQQFKVGETKEGVGISITYLAPTTHGTPGQTGTSFGAKLKVVEDGQTYFGEPKVTLGKGPDDLQITPSLRATLAGMDASDRSIMLQMPYMKAVYPIELFYKPMTGLVWLGAAILTLGGLLSAFYRRNRLPVATEEAQPSPAVKAKPSSKAILAGLK